MNQYKISKEFQFSASHELKGLHKDHPCMRNHGHNYIARFFFKSSELSEHGFVIDYRELKVIKDFIDNKLDHRYLNDIMEDNPTAENLALFLYLKFKTLFPILYKVEISETPKTSAIYEET